MSQYCHSICHSSVAMIKHNGVLGESLVGERMERDIILMGAPRYER